MNYSRYWDLHLCSTTFTDDDLKKATTDFFTHRGTQYRYDFLKDMRKQAEYREGKKEGYESGAWASLWSRENMRVLDSSELTNSRKSFLVPPPQGGISEELSRLRYVSCLVSIEKLKESAKNPQVRYPQLQSLVRWIADNQTINKLRINCHGSGDSKSGFSMGGKLSPAELFDALVHHGLTIAPKTVQNLTGLAHAARWKRDNEVEACEKCKKQFSVLRRRHHCRRCGGIFCETCSSWKVDLVVALAGESNKTVPNVKNARVCQQCYEDAIAAMAAREVGWAAERSDLQGNETIYGLKQVTLALCMGAMTEHGFSQEHGKVGQVAIAQGANATGAHGGFVAGSLAHRLLAELRRHRLLGIKVTASNQVVSGGTGQIQNQLGVEYPTDTYDGLGTNYKSFKDSSSFDFPARVWGSSTILKRVWDAKAKTGPADLPSSYKIELFSDGRSLTFGASRQNSKAFAWLQTDFLHEWSFSGWGIRHGVIYSAPSPSARNADDTLVITPPPRVATVAVRNDSKNQSRVFLTSRAGVDSFKDYKSYGVS